MDTILPTIQSYFPKRLSCFGVLVINTCSCDMCQLQVLTRGRSLYAETVQPIKAALTNSNDVNESFFGKLYAADLN